MAKPELSQLTALPCREAMVEPRVVGSRCTTCRGSSKDAGFHHGSLSGLVLIIVGAQLYLL